MKEQSIDNIRAEIERLEKKLTGDMWTDMEVMEEIMLLRRMVEAYYQPSVGSPDDSDFECIGCGS